MARKIVKRKYDASNAIMERPVDVFYGDKAEIITMSFVNLPKASCTDTEEWKLFLKETWDAFFPEMDTLLDFLRHTIYHTGMVGRFCKISCITTLDDVFPFLMFRFPNPDATFTTWCKLHEMAGFILEANSGNSELNTNFILDMHTRMNSFCDNSEVKIQFLNSEDLPGEQEHVLMYHITVRYINWDVPASSVIYDQSHSDSFSNPNEGSNAQPDDDYKELKFISSQPQPGPSNVTEDWNKYGAKPKKKPHSVKRRTNTSKQKKYKIDPIPIEIPAEVPMPEELARRKAIKRLILTSNIAHIDRMLAECASGDADSSAKNEENSETLETTEDLSFPPNSDAANSKEISSPSTKQANVRDTPSTSKPPVLVQPLPPSLATRSDLLFPPPFISLEDKNLSKTDDAILKDEACCSGGASSVSENKKSNPEEIPTAFKQRVLLHKPPRRPTRSDLHPSPFIPLDDKNLSKTDDAMLKDEPCCSRGASSVSENKKNMSMADLLLQREPTAHDEHFSIIDSDLELARNERRLDIAEAQIRALQKPFEDMIKRLKKENARYEIPVTGPDNIKPPKLHVQDYSSLQMPHIKLEDMQTDLASDDFQNINPGANIDEQSLQVREAILRHIIKTFFKDYKFSDAPREDGASATKTIDSSVQEHHIDFSSAEFNLDPESFEDCQSPCKNTAVSAACDQGRSSSRDDQNRRYRSVGSFVDKRTCKWEDILDRSRDPRTDPAATREISADEETEKTPENKLPFETGEPMTLETSDPSYDRFFEEIKQTINENPSFQDVSPQKSQNLQPSTYKSHSTPEKKSENLEVSQLARSEDYPKKRLSQEELPIEELSDMSEESLDLSDFNSSDLDYESSSEDEQ